MSPSTHHRWHPNQTPPLSSAARTPCPREHREPRYNPVNSQVSSASTATAGFAYDQAGNVIFDGLNNYWYNAEGQLCAVAQSGGITAYSYDAEGRRVAKGTLSGLPSGDIASQISLATSGTCGPISSATSSFALSSRYLLDLSGNQVTELNGAGNWVHTNVFGGGRLDATYDPKGLHFHLADPLGTRRVQTDVSGRVENSFLSLPFGDGFVSVPTALATADDATENHFTGKERDTESGNDYFGARYFASSMGRWLSPDYSLNGAIMELPQTWNKYSYEYNRPTFGTDPDGRCPPCVGALIGGVLQGGFDAGKQFIHNKYSFNNFSGKEFLANVAGGAVAGGLAGATGGASLVESALVGDLAAGTTSNIVGGIVTRSLDPNTPSNDVLSAGAVSGDALAGFVGGAGGHIAGDFVHVPGEPSFSMTGRNGRVYNQAYRDGLRALATRDQALENQAVRSNLGSGVSNFFSPFWNWLWDKHTDPPMNLHSTIRIFDENGNRIQ